MAPNDPLFKDQWALHRVGFHLVWDRLDKAVHAKPRVAVIDSGVSANHPDLNGSVTSGTGSALDDSLGHGTSVCGILAATRDNAMGIAGALACDLSVYKVSDASGWNWRAYYDALRDVGDQRVDVVNLSVGGRERDSLEAQLIDRLVKRGTLAVVAAGNHYRMGNPVLYPGALGNVIAVAGSDRSDGPWYKSSRGAHVLLAAPAEDIWTTRRIRSAEESKKLKDDEVGPYHTVSGTSFAAPFVTAALAAARSLRPDLPGTTIVQILGRSCDPWAKAPQTLGCGILNVVRFLDQVAVA